MKLYPCDLILLGIPIWALISRYNKLIGITGGTIWIIIWIINRKEFNKHQTTHAVQNASEVVK